MHCRTDDGKAFRTLNIIDEYSRECLAIRVDRKLNSGNVIDVLSDLFILRGIPSFIRSDNGPEFVAQAVQDWIKAVGAKTAYIEPGSPWENGYCESFNARFRDEFLNGEIFYSLREAQILIEEWRKHYNTKRPHSALGYRPPAPETIVQMDQRPVMHLCHVRLQDRAARPSSKHLERGCIRLMESKRSKSNANCPRHSAW